jgi:hypothetical protein
MTKQAIKDAVTPRIVEAADQYRAILDSEIRKYSRDIAMNAFPYQSAFTSTFQTFCSSIDDSAEILIDGQPMHPSHKCPYCRSWGEHRTNCVKCGAPID